MNKQAKTADEYLETLPEERRAILAAVRGAILANLPKGYEECMSYGMISYVVAHSIYPKGYPCKPDQALPLALLGSQKNHMAIYLMNVYGDPATEKWFRAAWQASGKKLDMGKSCVRFKK